MNDAKYIGLDVHQATISGAVLDSAGKLVVEAVIETKAEMILQFIHGLRGVVAHLLKPHVTQALVCDPRKNALMKAGKKNDRADARKVAELLYLNKLNPVYQGETGIRALKELARSYLTLEGRIKPQKLDTAYAELFLNFRLGCLGGVGFCRGS
jgi:hypothetical protein